LLAIVVTLLPRKVAAPPGAAVVSSLPLFLD
jgi:hypothetical protein